MAKKRAKKKLAGRPLSAAPLQTGLPTAEQLAAAEFAPTLGGYDVEARRDAAAAADRQRAVQGFTLALMRELGGMPAGVAADYAAAAKATEGLAAASAAELRGEGSSASARLAADLSAIGAPAEAGAESTQRMADVFGAGAGAQYVLEGSGPAGLLAGEGARQTAFARQLPGFAALSGQQNIRQALFEAERQRQDREDRRAATLREMGARIPAYRLQLENEQTRRREAAQELALKQRGLTLNERLAAAQFGLKRQNQAFQQGATTERLRQGRASLRIREAENDRQFRLGVGRLRLSTAQYNLAVARENRLRRGGLTPKQEQELRNTTTDLVEDFYHGVPQKQRYNSATDKYEAVPGTGRAPVKYWAALRRLLSRGIPYSVARGTLDRYYAPGEGGRPLMTRKQQKRYGAR